MSNDEHFDNAEDLQEQIDLKRKRLRLLQRQCAMYGISTLGLILSILIVC
jgi:hypothetical protein